MAHLTVIGATGYAGAAIVAEAAKRGHAVTGVSRNAPAEPVDGVTYVEGSALEPGILARAFEGADVVVSATSPRGDMATRQLELSGVLAQSAADARVRLIVVGGFSSLRPAPGAPRFIEGDIPEQYRTEAEAGHSVLRMLLEAPDGLDWTFVSPAATFGSFAPGAPTGAYSLGGEIAQLDADGKSFVSAQDFALAIVDLAEAEAGKGHVSVVA